jgi:enoyl-CoA hydratase
MTIAREVIDGIGVLTMDDGRVNAFDLGFFADLDAAFDACAQDAAIVLAGREGMFSAGLNTKVLAGLDTEGLVALLEAFAHTMLRVWLEPRPVVAAVTGHAVAGGTVLAMCADHAVAAQGPYRWGLTETTIGFAMPAWILAIARGNVSAHRLDDLILPGASVDPDEAVAVGYADALAPPSEVLPVALAKARDLAQLPRGTYAATKHRLRGPAAEAARAGLHADLTAAMSTPSA